MSSFISQLLAHRCQNAAWREHKKSCLSKEQAQQLSLSDIRVRLAHSMGADKWDEALSWESLIDHLGLAEGHDREGIACAREGIAHAYHITGKFDKGGQMFLRCAEAWRALKRFSDEVSAITRASKCFRKAGDGNYGIVLLERARDDCVERGFVLMESKFCMELGKALRNDKRLDDAVAQNRRALAVCASHARHPGLPADSGEDRAYMERAALRELVHVLTKTGKTEEADNLFRRLREGDDGSVDCLLWGHCLRGCLHESRQNYDEAAEAFQAAVELAEKKRGVPGNSLDNHAKKALSRAKFFLWVDHQPSDGPRTFEMMKMVLDASLARDWPGVLRWEKDLEWMIAPGMRLTNTPFRMMHAWAGAHFEQGDYGKAASLYERCGQVLGEKHRFRDEAVMLSMAGHCFLSQKDAQGGERLFQKARDLGAQHGFFSTECAACLGLGRAALVQGRTRDAEDLFRVSLSAVDFVEDVPNFPRALLAKDVNVALAGLLMKTDRFEDAGPSVQNLLALSEAEPDPEHAVHFEARTLAVRFHLRRGDSEQADKEGKVLPSFRSFRFS